MEAARCQPEGKVPAHDAFTHRLQRQQPDREGLRQEAIWTYLGYPADDLAAIYVSRGNIHRLDHQIPQNLKICLPKVEYLNTRFLRWAEE